jgi:hypothetical protein
VKCPCVKYSALFNMVLQIFESDYKKKKKKKKKKKRAIPSPGRLSTRFAMFGFILLPSGLDYESRFTFTKKILCFSCSRIIFLNDQYIYLFLFATHFEAGKH